MPTSSLSNLVSGFGIGALSSGAYTNLNASFDQVRIFNRALTAGEVTTLYNESAYKYTLASTTPVLDTNPSWAGKGGQIVSAYTADNYAGKKLTVGATSEYTTLTVDASSTAGVPVFTCNKDNFITSGSTFLATVGGVESTYTAGTVTKTNPSAGVWKYSINGTTPAMASNPTAGRAAYIVLTSDTSGVVTSGDTVSMNSGTAGANQTVVWGNVTETGTAAPYTYTLTSPTPSLVQIPTIAVKGAKTPIGSPASLTRATDTITAGFAKTPISGRSVAISAEATIGDKITSIQADLYYYY